MIEIARIVVCDCKIALTKRNQVFILAFEPQVKHPARRANTLAELTSLGKSHRSIAVLLCRQLGIVLLIESSSLQGQVADGLAILLCRGFFPGRFGENAGGGRAAVRGEHSPVRSRRCADLRAERADADRYRNR